MTNVKQLNQWLVLILFTYLCVELFAYGGLQLLSRVRHIQYEPIDTLSVKHQEAIAKLLRDETSYSAFSPTLGWTIKPNGSSALYQANSAGIRSSREYAISPPPGVRRIGAFGDSFTHATDVKNSDAWAAVMESYDANLEVINFGVGGFGLGQAYLRYQELGRQYQSHIVLIGFLSENIKRNVNSFRPFYNPVTGMPLAKPRFIVENGSLVLVPNPMQSFQDYEALLRSPRDILPKIGATDYYYEKRRYKSSGLDWSPAVRIGKVLAHRLTKDSDDEDIIVDNRYNETSEAFIVTTKLFAEFYRAVEADNAKPIILLFPNEGDVEDYRETQQKRYSPLLSYFDSANYEYIDLMDALKEADLKDLFIGHYSPLGNRLVAEHIFEHISSIDVADEKL